MSHEVPPLHRARSFRVLPLSQCALAALFVLSAEAAQASRAPWDLPHLRGIVSMTISRGDRSGIMRRLREARRQRPVGAFRVLDIGAAAKPWSLEVLDAIADKFPQWVGEPCFVGRVRTRAAAACCAGQPQRYFANAGAANRSLAQRGTCLRDGKTPPECCIDGQPRLLTRFAVNLNSESSWAPIIRHVERHGKFDFVIASHVLEDISNPSVVLEMMPRVAAAGFVSVPSKYIELERGVNGGNYQHRGGIHHRWIFTLQSGVLVGIPKLSFIDSDRAIDEALTRAAKRPRALDAPDLSFQWHGDLPFRLLNDDYMGPTAEAVRAMFVSALSEPDDCDQAAASSEGELAYGAGVL